MPTFPCPNRKSIVFRSSISFLRSALAFVLKKTITECRILHSEILPAEVSDSWHRISLTLNFHGTSLPDIDKWFYMQDKAGSRDQSFPAAFRVMRTQMFHKNWSEKETPFFLHKDRGTLKDFNACVIQFSLLFYNRPIF